ncbi:MAG: aminomethyl-transferring glycine dehydrogenase subunit GcvPA [Pseudomonadota bacterium]
MRYHPLKEDDRALMLRAVGVGAVNDLFSDVPNAHLLDGVDDLPDGLSEMAVERAMARLAGASTPAGSTAFFVGAGAYRHHVPASVDHLIQRSEFLTSYTPYQAEISQGTLQVLFEFQTQVARLTGMEVANASMYDGSTAAAEAVTMAGRITRRRRAILAGGLHPHYRDVIATIATGMEITALPADPEGRERVPEIGEDVACVVVQSPSFYGHLVDLQPIVEAAHKAGALVVSVFTEAVALGAIEPPGAYGADIVVGEGQSIGNALNFGGPYVGLFATRKKYLRQMPGRLAGETVDADGRRGFVLTLSTREQHIRRDKATSNICTNSGLCALAFTIHMTLLGGTGLSRLATLNHARAVALADALAAVPGVSVLNDTFFNEFTIRITGDARHVVEALAERGVMAGVPAVRLDPGAPPDLIVTAATELTTDEDIATYAKALGDVL